MVCPLSEHNTKHVHLLVICWGLVERRQGAIKALSTSVVLQCTILQLNLLSNYRMNEQVCNNFMIYFKLFSQRVLFVLCLSASLCFFYCTVILENRTVTACRVSRLLC